MDNSPIPSVGELYVRLRPRLPEQQALTACHLGDPFGYVDEPPVTGAFTTRHPFPARLGLGALA